LYVTASGLDSDYTESENLVDVTAGKLAQPNRAVTWCLSVSGHAITEHPNLDRFPEPKTPVRDTPDRRVRYVTRLPAILAELCRIVHR
jgi:hypothetical protein